MFFQQSRSGIERSIFHCKTEKAQDWLGLPIIGFYTIFAPEAQRKLAGGGGFAKPPEAMAKD